MRLYCTVNVDHGRPFFLDALSSYHFPLIAVGFRWFPRPIQSHHIESPVHNTPERLPPHLCIS